MMTEVEYRIRLKQIEDLIDVSGEHELSYVPIDLDDARWLVDTIDRLQQQVDGLADLLAEAARIEEK